MPLFQGQVVVSGILSTRTTEKVMPAAANAQLALLAEDSKRKGHCVKNTGTTRLIVAYGVDTPDAEPLELFRVILGPGDIYLYDKAEVIPFSAITTVAGGTLQIIEMLG